MPSLAPFQLALLSLPGAARIFLEGPAGSGKTTAGVERLLWLMSDYGAAADSILLLVPQRTLAIPYTEALSQPDVAAGGVISVLTLGGLAQRMVDLFWPLAAEAAGFAYPDLPPHFLTLETAQYYMARLVRPLLEQGYFDSLTISRNRLYSQLLDNLNKAALLGFPHTQVGERLKAAWVGEASQAHVYTDAQDCANRFREYCLANNLLDFSLQLEIFCQHLWTNPLCRRYLTQTYHHLIVDNIEEDTPVAHDLLRQWLPDFDSALLINDHDAGYRRFLGADPQTAASLKELCDTHITFSETFTSSPALLTLGTSLSAALGKAPSQPTPTADSGLSGLAFEQHRYYPQMLDWVTGQIAALVFEEQTPPGEIAVLAPFLSDALRYSLTHRLEVLGIPVRSQRPSRALREEPAAQCLLTLLALAHPAWGIHPTKFDVAYALVQAIAGLDLVRAQLLTEIVYRMRSGTPTLSSFERIQPDVQERITYVIGQRFDLLRTWLEDYATRPPEPPDIFLSRLFGELLSQPGFGFHAEFAAGEVAANLIESARKFRWALSPLPAASDEPEQDTIFDLGKEYFQMVQDGVVAAQYLRSWQAQSDNAVLLAPAHTFLMSNHPVDVQFWLDVGSRGWFERLYQPLTQPYVLSRQWPVGALWTDADEVEASQDTLYRLALGLTRRCRSRVYLGLSELGEQGYEQKGALLKAIQRVLRG